MKEQPAGPAHCILVVEDDPAIRELIIVQLQREPYDVLSAATVAEARALLSRCVVDLLILDLNLPDGDGLDMCRELRKGGYAGAVMIVTARHAAVDRVLGLEFGADDYLTKPFEPRELLLRVRNVLRHARGTQPSYARVAYFGAWRLDLHQRRLINPDNELVMLSAAEFRLLRRFLSMPGKVLSREELLPERSTTVAFDRTLDAQISRLRHKLTTDVSDEVVILTVRNEGYVMPGPVRFE